MSDLQAFVEETCAEFNRARVFEDGYSGRGMMGAKCVAIHGSHVECLETIGQIMWKRMHAMMEEILTLDQDEGFAIARQVLEQELSDDFQVLMMHRADNFGHDFVYYFPNLSYQEN